MTMRTDVLIDIIIVKITEEAVVMSHGEVNQTENTQEVKVRETQDLSIGKGYIDRKREH